MDTITDFLVRHIPEVYFFYGLSFFSMGLAILLESGRSSAFDFSRALRPLAAFGLVHGGHEWFEMFLLYHPNVCASSLNNFICSLRLFLLALSFLLLVMFGARLIAGPERRHLFMAMLGCVLLVWLVGLAWLVRSQPSFAESILAADVYTRYSLAIPGAALTAWGLVLQRQKFIQAGMQSFGLDVVVAALAFGLYGGIGQLFVSPSGVFPSEAINTDTFIRLFGFPIQIFRALMALLAAIFIIRSLRAFEVEAQQQLEVLREAQVTERQRLEATRAELLHRTVKAQEAERQRIARELHDETGQTLTALALGLRGLSEKIPSNPERAAKQAKQLEELATNGIDELKRLVSGLHPPQLDDLGLPAALRWYSGEISNRFGLEIHFSCRGEKTELPPEIRTVLFRIAQEAITNVVRHAQATQAWLELEMTPTYTRLKVQDNGRGFDVEPALDQRCSKRPCWGLLGMIERASLVGGTCQIRALPGSGTTVETIIGLEGEAR